MAAATPLTGRGSLASRIEAGKAGRIKAVVET